jgi:hypothetical protein
LRLVKRQKPGLDGRAERYVFVVRVQVREGRLNQGDRIDVIYGDTSKGSRGMQGGVITTGPEPIYLVAPPASSIVEACDEIGTAVAREPWLERHPATVLAAPTRHDGRWVLADDSGALPLLATPRSLATVLAATDGEPATITVEWTPHGVIPLTVHLADRALDVGPVADPSFVGVA